MLNIIKTTLVNLNTAEDFGVEPNFDDLIFASRPGITYRMSLADLKLMFADELVASDIGLDSVDNTSDMNKPVSTATQDALALKADKTAISNINNTSDANKPVSTAAQAALDTKANVSAISNVNNTSDADKPVSTATQTALDAKINSLALSNVNNTSDLNKPLSTASTDALALKANASDLTEVNNTSDLNKPLSTASTAALNLKANASDLTNVNNTSDADKPVSTAAQTALNLKANAADLTEVDNTSDQNKPLSTASTDALALKANASDLTNVDNTSDEDKPVSTATQNALNLKATVSSVEDLEAELTTHAENEDNPHSVTKADVMLGNVDNTSDVDKPVSTSTAALLANKADLVNGLVPLAQLPLSLEELEIHPEIADFPVSGVSEKLYISESDNRSYRWTGSTYVTVGATELVLGTVTGTAADGGVVAALVGTTTAHGARVDNPHAVTKGQVGLGDVDNTSDVNKPVSTAVVTALGMKADASSVSEVDNTSDVNKPVSTAVVNALLLKVDVSAVDEVDNTSDADKPLSTVAVTALGLKADASAVSEVDNTSDVDKPVSTAQATAIGLKMNTADYGNVDNVSDADKPVSTAVANALLLKANASAVSEVNNTSDADKPISTAVADALSDKADASAISEMNNTSDANKPVSTAQATAIGLKADASAVSNVNNTSDADKPLSIASVNALALKADASAVSNVDNTSDANKPLSNAANTALMGKSNAGDMVAVVREDGVAEDTKFASEKAVRDAIIMAPSGLPSKGVNAAYDGEGVYILDGVESFVLPNAPLGEYITYVVDVLPSSTNTTVFTTVSGGTINGIVDSSVSVGLVSAITFHNTGTNSWVRTALGASTLAIGTITGTAADGGVVAALSTSKDTFEARTDNPHSVTKAQVSLGNVDNTADSAKPVSGAMQTALDNKANASAVSNVDNTSDVNKPVSIATQTSLDNKADASAVSNVDNTSDANKPVSTAQATAIGLKADASGLTNVDNTSDVNKPVSIATQTSLDNKADASAISNMNNTSDADKPVSTATQNALGAKADASAVSNVDNTADSAKPVSGPTQTALDDKTDSSDMLVAVRATGTAENTKFVSEKAVRDAIMAIPAGLAVGTSAGTAGDGLVLETVKGDLDALEARTDNPHAVTQAQVGLGNVNNTSDADKPVSTATQGLLDDKADVGNMLQAVRDVANAETSKFASEKAVRDAIEAIPAGLAIGTAMGTAGDGAILNTVKGDLDTLEARTDNPHGVTKAQVSLTNVDDTSDVNKPISTATQDALDDKADASGLTNVDNTSDADKPLSVADILALADKADKSDMVTTVRPTATAEDSKFASEKAVRGAIEAIPAGLAIGTTAGTAGDGLVLETAKNDLDTLEGQHATHSGATTNPHSVTKAQVLLGDVDNTSDANKPVSTATQNALDAKADAGNMLVAVRATGAAEDTKFVSEKAVRDAIVAIPAGLVIGTTSGTAGEGDVLATVKGDLDSLEARTDNPHSVTKAQVLLANVDNTSDADKPVSTATQNALDDKADAGNMVVAVRPTATAEDTKFASEKAVRDAIEAIPAASGGLSFVGTNVADSGEGTYVVDDVHTLTLPSTGMTVGDRRRYVLTDIATNIVSQSVPNQVGWVQAGCTEIAANNTTRASGISWPIGTTPTNFVMHVTSGGFITARLFHTASNTEVWSGPLLRDDGLPGSHFGPMTMDLASAGIIPGDDYHYAVTGTDGSQGRNISKSPTDTDMYYTIEYDEAVPAGVVVSVASGSTLNGDVDGSATYMQDTTIDADYIATDTWSITSDTSFLVIGEETGSAADGGVVSGLSGVSSEAYDDFSFFPATGIADKLYVDVDERAIYFWDVAEGGFALVQPTPAPLKTGVVTYLSGTIQPTSCLYYELLNDTLSFEAGVAGSEFHCNFAPTAAVVLDVSKVVAGVTTSIGTINVASTGVGTFTSFGAEALVAGDSIRIDSPSDVFTMADVFIRLMGTRPYPLG